MERRLRNKIFEGKNCLITGATGGLGKQIAIELAQAGCNLFLTGRDNKKLELLKKELKIKKSRNRNILQISRFKKEWGC